MKSCKYCNGSIIDDYCESCFAIYNLNYLIGIVVDIKSNSFIHYIKTNEDWIYFFISGSDKEIYEIYFPEYYTNQKENEKIMYDTLIMLKNNLAFV